MLNQNSAVGERRVKSKNSDKNASKLRKSFKISRAVALVEELAGSLKIPDHLRGKNLDKIIEEARDEYFMEKYSKKTQE